MKLQQNKVKKGKARKKIVQGVLLAFLTIIISVGGYIYYQFRLGVAEAERMANEYKTEESTDDKGEKVFQFNGKRDLNGYTNILLLGSDTRDKDDGNADTIMILHYHSSKGIVKLTSIMRDIYVEIPGVGKRKMNAAHAYGGPRLLQETIKDNFDIDIHYFTAIDFKGFVHLVDELFPQGIEIQVPKRMSKNIGVILEPGLQKLNGKQLLGYVRFRSDAENDFGRVERQQEVVNKVIGEVMTFHGVTKIPKLVGMTLPFVTTNLRMTNIIGMGMDYMLKQSKEISTFRIPVEGTFTDERVDGVGLVLDIDLAENREALHEFLKSESIYSQK